MKRPPKKRIIRRNDGYYYPQSRHYLFWFDYDDTHPFSSCTSVRYVGEENAREFLDKQHISDIAAVATANQATILKWEPKA